MIRAGRRFLKILFRKCVCMIRRNLLTAFTAFFSCAVVIFSPLTIVGAQADFSSFMTEINEKHAALDAPDDSLAQYRYDFTNGKPLLTAEDPVLFYNADNTPPEKSTISRLDARLETAYLFRLLRTQYGLYTYAGGDPAFEAAERSILQDLAGTEDLPLSRYQEIVTRNLKFIRDSHLIFGSYHFTPRLTLYSNEQRNFYRDQDSETFYMDEECTVPVLSIDGGNPAVFLRPAIGQNGELTYYLYALRPTEDSLALRLSYSRSGRTKNALISLHPARYLGEKGPPPNEEIFSFQKVRGLPSLRVTDMSFGWGHTQNGLEAFERFIDAASAIQEEPFAVMDLTWNPGGDIQKAYDWFKAYTGHMVEPNSRELRIVPGTIWREKCYSDPEQWAMYTQSISAMGLKKDGSYYISRPEKQFLKNDGPNFLVLVSQKTASAAEAMADAMRNLENTLLIGTNTGGVLTNLANYSLEMPYSGLLLQFGEELRYWNPSDFREGFGMEPDLYLTGENLEKRLEKFMDRYLQTDL